MGGYYRRPSYPAFQAVTTLISAVNRSAVQLLPIRSVMLDSNEVKRIHMQRCAKAPDHWAHTPYAQQLLNARKEATRREKSASSTSSRRAKPPSQSSANKDMKNRIKEMKTKTSDHTYITFNMGQTCPWPTSGQGCLFTKQGTTLVLEHSCAFVDAAGVRCKQPHAMSKNH